MTELWDLYDENRKPIHKTHLRGTPIPSGAYHLVVEIWVLNDKGQILIDKRHPNKPLGGLWECTCGSVTLGENSRMGAVRELEEELGIKALMNELTLIHSMRVKDCFFDTYVLKKDIDLNNLILQENEVTDVKFVSLDELNKMWLNNELAIKERFKMYQDQLKFYTEKNA